MEDFEYEIKQVETTTSHPKNEAVIKAIGVGGGGGNMINHMIEQGIETIDLIAANTDAQALEDSLAPYKLQLGEGLGAGMKPEQGRDAALKSFEEIKTMLGGADLVFISAGLGGGTGTGAAPIIAQAAKEIGALTVSVVTLPFIFECPERTRLAKAGLEELKRESDSIIVIQNEKLLHIFDEDIAWEESFQMVDDVLARAVSGITKVIRKPKKGINNINLDFADVKTVMSHRGLALMGSGDAAGENSGYDAAKMAIESPLLDNISLDGAKGVLVHFDLHPKYPLKHISKAMMLVNESVDDSASVIFGTTKHEDMAVDEVRVTIIATGSEDQNSVPERKIMKQTTIPMATTNSCVTNMVKGKRVVGGESYDDILDIPTWQRKQMD